MSGERDALVVIGAGHAGTELAVQAREAGWQGRIQLVGDETALPYHRPPLSKAYLAGTATLDSLHLKARATLEKAGVELVQGRRVQTVDRADRRVAFEDGSSIGYARLALATGGRPVRCRRRSRARPLAPTTSTTCARSPTSIASAGTSSPVRASRSSAAATSASRWPRWR